MSISICFILRYPKRNDAHAESHINIHQVDLVRHSRFPRDPCGTLYMDDLRASNMHGDSSLNTTHRQVCWTSEMLNK